MSSFEIITDITQGTDEWFDMRRGIPTASNFSRIMKTASREKSKAQPKYIGELIDQLYYRDDTPQVAAMIHGQQTEDDSREWYERETGNDVVEVAFVFGPEREYGGSPDGLVDSPNGLEIKSPHSLDVHLKYLEKQQVPNVYKAQVFGLMWLLGSDWWDFVSYYKGEQGLLVRTTKDDDEYKQWAAAWHDIFHEFLDDLHNAKEKANAQKKFPTLEQAKPKLWSWQK